MQTLRYQFQEAAPEEDFGKVDFAWLVLPEFHLVLPLIAACYMPQARMFRAIVNLSGDQWVPKIKFIEAPKRAKSASIKETLDQIALAIYDDPKVRGTFWLVPQQKIKEDGDGLPEKWIEFSGQYLAGLTYMEPGRTILPDSTLEASCEILTTSPITKWGTWQEKKTLKKTPATAAPSLGQTLGDVATLFGFLAMGTLKTWSQKAEESRKLNARQGSFYSYLPYPILFDQIANQLSEPIGKHCFGVSADRQLMQMGASTNWHDYGCQGVPDMPQRLDLRLRFVPDGSGTRIDYEWLHYHQFAPGLATNQLVNIVNGWIKNIAESVPPPAPMIEEKTQQSGLVEPEKIPECQPEPEPQPVNKAHRLVPAGLAATAKQVPASATKKAPVAQADSSSWGKEIRIDWPLETGYSPSIFTPESPLQELKRLACVYEQRDAYCLLFMDDSDYFRLQSWIKARQAAS